MIWKDIAEKLQNGEALYLLLVIESKGSSPGRHGFKMLVTAEGAPVGSIGGGLMELNLSNEAKALLQQKNLKAFAKRQTHRKDVPHSSGMICSGEQTVAFIPLTPEKDLQLFEQISRACEGEKPQKIRITPKGPELLPQSGPRQLENYCYSETDWQYEESLSAAREVYIVGAGHVGQATARLFDFLQCRVHLLDNRPKLLHSLQGKLPATLRQVAYNDIQQHIPHKPNIAILIMTTRYDEDLAVLRQLLEHPCHYLGMLGSKAKVRQMFALLKAEGVKQELLQRIHAPIGLPIHSQTPEEIAVSIAAEYVGMGRG